MSSEHNSMKEEEPAHKCPMNPPAIPESFKQLNTANKNISYIGNNLNGLSPSQLRQHLETLENASSKTEGPTPMKPIEEPEPKKKKKKRKKKKKKMTSYKDIPFEETIDYSQCKTQYERKKLKLSSILNHILCSNLKLLFQYFHNKHELNGEVYYYEHIKASTLEENQKANYFHKITTLADEDLQKIDTLNISKKAYKLKKNKSEKETKVVIRHAFRLFLGLEEDQFDQLLKTSIKKAVEGVAKDFLVFPAGKITSTSIFNGLVEFITKELSSVQHSHLLSQQVHSLSKQYTTILMDSLLLGKNEETTKLSLDELMIENKKGTILTHSSKKRLHAIKKLVPRFIDNQIKAVSHELMYKYREEAEKPLPKGIIIKDLDHYMEDDDATEDSEHECDKHKVKLKDRRMQEPIEGNYRQLVREKLNKIGDQFQYRLDWLELMEHIVERQRNMVFSQLQDLAKVKGTKQRELNALSTCSRLIPLNDQKLGGSVSIQNEPWISYTLSKQFQPLSVDEHYSHLAFMEKCVLEKPPKKPTHDLVEAIAVDIFSPSFPNLPREKKRRKKSLKLSTRRPIKSRPTRSSVNTPHTPSSTYHSPTTDKKTTRLSSHRLYEPIYFDEHLTEKEVEDIVNPPRDENIFIPQVKKLTVEEIAALSSSDDEESIESSNVTYPQYYSKDVSVVDFLKKPIDYTIHLYHEKMERERSWRCHFGLGIKPPDALNAKERAKYERELAKVMKRYANTTKKKRDKLPKFPEEPTPRSYVREDCSHFYARQGNFLDRVVSLKRQRDDKDDEPHDVVLEHKASFLEHAAQHEYPSKVHRS